MLIRSDDGTYTAGPLDVLLVYRHVGTGRYHLAFYEEAPRPGPIADVADVRVVRLKSKMHHTQGAATLAEALVQVAGFRSKVLRRDDNVDLAPVPWDGTIGDVLIAPNWVAAGRPFKAAA